MVPRSGSQKWEVRVLELKNLQAGYGHMKVLHGVDLMINEGEIVALLGSNGAGKSTLNNNVSGVFQPTGGQILFEAPARGAALTAVTMRFDRLSGHQFIHARIIPKAEAGMQSAGMAAAALV